MVRAALFATLFILSSVSSAHQGSASDPAQTNIARIEYENAEVREALRSLFKLTSAFFTMAPDVQGIVSVKLANVPFEMALQSILRQVDATYRVEGGIYTIIRNPIENTVPMSEKRVYLTFTGEPLGQVLSEVFRDFELNFVMSPDLKGNVHGRYSDANLTQILRSLGATFGFRYELIDGVYILKKGTQRNENVSADAEAEGPVPVRTELIVEREMLARNSVPEGWRQFMYEKRTARTFVRTTVGDIVRTTLSGTNQRFKVMSKPRTVTVSVRSGSPSSQLYMIKEALRLSITEENGVLIIRDR